MSNNYDIIIVNCIVVTDTDISEYDIAIKDEKIVKVVSRGELKDATATKTIDAEGGYVMVRSIILFNVDHSEFSVARRCRRTCSPRRASSLRKRINGR